MADTTWRALVRDAEARGDGAAWSRAAQALARAGRHDDAGRAALRASLAGADATDALDALAPPLEAFSPRPLGDRFGLGRLSQAAWSACGAQLFASHGGAVVRFDVRGGAATPVLELPGQVTALALAPDDALLVAGVLDEQQRAALVAVDLISGAKRALGRGHETIRELVVTHEHVVSAELHRVRAYALDATPTSRSVWSLRGSSALDRAGGFTLLQEPGSPESLERYPAGREVRGRGRPLAAPHPFVGLALPAGRRTALVRDGHWDVDLLEGEREVVSRTSLARLPTVYSLALAPSGRQLALTHRVPHGLERSTTVTLVDLLTGAHRKHDLDARPREPVWSPSGRRVAFPTDQGVLALLEAPSGDEAVDPPPASPAAHEHAWVELRSPRQFWRARVTGHTVEYHHGRLGAAGQRGTVACDDAARAARELERRRREKERGGYVRWPPSPVTP